MKRFKEWLMMSFVIFLVDKKGFLILMQDGYFDGYLKKARKYNRVEMDAVALPDDVFGYGS